MNQSDDPVRFVFDRPMAASPGSHFNYNSGCAMVLGDVVRTASGLRADRFAEAQLFGPLGISDYTWAKLPSGAVHTGGGLSLRPRDMAKIGLLMLRGGRWQGNQIVSEAWTEESTRRQAPDQHYGYQWWLHSFHMRNRALASYRADGYGGQYIFVFPDLDLVAIFTGWSPGDEERQAMDMLQRYILPAMTEKALPTHLRRARSASCGVEHQCPYSSAPRGNCNGARGVSLKESRAVFLFAKQKGAGRRTKVPRMRRNK